MTKAQESNSQGNTKTIQLMKDIDKRYRATSGLDSRTMYSIFYSRIDPSQVMVLGINPGGDPASWSMDYLASQSFYENWEHEYVDCRYAIQEPMLPLLKKVLSINDDGVRRIPKSNLVFRRSPGTDDFQRIHMMSLVAAQNEAKPFLEEIISSVDPTIVILEGITTFETFKKKYCTSGSTSIVDEPLFTLHRGRQVRIYQADKATISCTNRAALLIGIGHPSSFGTKPEFPKVVDRIKVLVSNHG